MQRGRASKVRYNQKVKLRKSDQLDIVCENCGAQLDGKHVNINSSLAKCGECHTVFSLKEDHFFSQERAGRPEMIMPEGTDVLELNDSLDIRIDWLKSHPRATLGFFTIFAAFWNGIMAVFIGQMISSGSYEGLPFMSIHLLVGLGLIFYLAMMYLNYTDIIVTDSYIEIGHRPIKNPFVSTKYYDADDIKQLYVSKYVASKTNGNPNYAYALFAILKTNGKKVKLIKGMNRETQLYLEQEIERHLRIQDKPVSGSEK